MSDSQFVNTSFLEVFISSKNARVFIYDLRDHTFQIIFDSWWASMNVGSKSAIAWNNPGHEPSWRFYLHWRIEETGSTGIICIICHQVLGHPSEHGTSSMGKHLLATVHIAKGKRINRVTSIGIDKYNCWWNLIGHIEGTRQSWNYYCKFPKEIHIGQLDVTYINTIERHNTANWQQRTS